MPVIKHPRDLLPETKLKLGLEDPKPEVTPVEKPDLKAKKDKPRRTISRR
jgi:hypothetical protein